jgi:hypothetical protein
VKENIQYVIQLAFLSSVVLQATQKLTGYFIKLYLILV